MVEANSIQSLSLVPSGKNIIKEIFLLYTTRYYCVWRITLKHTVTVSQKMVDIIKYHIPSATCQKCTNGHIPSSQSCKENNVQTKPHNSAVIQNDTSTHERILL